MPTAQELLRKSKEIQKGKKSKAAKRGLEELIGGNPKPSTKQDPTPPSISTDQLNELEHRLTAKDERIKELELKLKNAEQSNSKDILLKKDKEIAEIKEKLLATEAQIESNNNLGKVITKLENKIKQLEDQLENSDVAQQLKSKDEVISKLQEENKSLKTSEESEDAIKKINELSSTIEALQKELDIKKNEASDSGQDNNAIFNLKAAQLSPKQKIVLNYIIELNKQGNDNGWIPLGYRDTEKINELTSFASNEFTGFIRAIEKYKIGTAQKMKSKLSKREKNHFKLFL